MCTKCCVSIDPANITNKERNYAGVNEGADALLDCISDALPSPIFTWYHPNGSVLTNETDRVEIFDVILQKDNVTGYEIKSQLRVATVEPQDYGLYKCEVYNGMGNRDNLTIELNGTSK